MSKILRRPMFRGGGDVNEGARRMYQTMDKQEAMA